MARFFKQPIPTVDKGIALLPIQINTEAVRKYPLNVMEVGDSFFVPKKTNNMASLFKRSLPKKFAARTVTENNIRGVRVWRTV